MTLRPRHDPAIIQALREAEEEYGEPLLPWDKEVIVASMERRPHAKQRPPSTPLQKEERQIPLIAWHLDPEANRAASESSTTALNVLLMTLSGMPNEALQSVGIVGVGAVASRRPALCQRATAANIGATPLLRKAPPEINRTSS
ncbi:hypothetical protein SEPCBS119000_000370 [Sporothrix epigloea]|uniref:Uncharacterized protein n=1 Tax=Sporothrix epigloea TaxID=1892477 RepID=A0ABP0D763_9PEZI